MKHREFLIQKNETDDDPIHVVQKIGGLPTLHTDDERIGGGFLITLRGLDEALEGSALEDGAVYSISKMIEGKREDAAYIYCKKLIFKGKSHQVYLAAVGRSNLLKLQILEAWSDGAVLSWRDLDPMFRDAWMYACMSRVSSDNWRQSPVANTIVLVLDGVESEADFYCCLGEQLFGYKGYAGSNLDAFYDVLSCNDLRGITIHIPNEERLVGVLQGVTGDADYFSKFKKVFTDAKVDLRLGNIHSY